MISYLIDTDQVIDFLKGKPETTAKLGELFHKGMAISSITLCELYDGVYGSKYKDEHIKNLNSFLEFVTVLDVNDKISEVFGKQRAKLRKIGNLIDNFDLLIASTCLCYELTLLTGNLRHFQRIEGLKINT